MTAGSVGVVRETLREARSRGFRGARRVSVRGLATGVLAATAFAAAIAAVAAAAFAAVAALAAFARLTDSLAESLAECPVWTLSAETSYTITIPFCLGEP